MTQRSPSRCQLGPWLSLSFSLTVSPVLTMDVPLHAFLALLGPLNLPFTVSVPTSADQLPLPQGWLPRAMVPSAAQDLEGVATWFQVSNRKQAFTITQQCSYLVGGCYLGPNHTLQLL